MVGLGSREPTAAEADRKAAVGPRTLLIGFDSSGLVTTACYRPLSNCSWSKWPG